MRGVAIVTVLVGALGACNPVYQPGSFPDPVTFDCLDVTVHAAWRTEQKGPIVVWDLGNRCEHSVLVDLGTATVVAGDEQGHTVATTAYDPDHELRVRSLDARISGQEWIEYRPASEIAHVAWLDVDIGGVSSAPRTTRWIRVTMPVEPTP
jgi:hypothetical protein